MLDANKRTVLALRALADRLETSEIDRCSVINHALSLGEGDDPEELLWLLQRGAVEVVKKELR